MAYERESLIEKHLVTEAEPVAWDYEWASCFTCEGPQNFKRVIEREAPPEWAIDEGQARNIIPLYRHAQPAPVVPDEATPENIEILASTFAPRGVTYQWDRDECNAAADSWNACRAAMLQGGK